MSSIQKLFAALCAVGSVVEEFTVEQQVKAFRKVLSEVDLKTLFAVGSVDTDFRSVMEDFIAKTVQDRISKITARKTEKAKAAAENSMSDTESTGSIQDDYLHDMITAHKKFSWADETEAEDDRLEAEFNQATKQAAKQATKPPVPNNVLANDWAKRVDAFPSMADTMSTGVTPKKNTYAFTKVVSKGKSKCKGATKSTAKSTAKGATRVKPTKTSENWFYSLGIYTDENDTFLQECDSDGYPINWRCYSTGFMSSGYKGQNGLQTQHKPTADPNVWDHQIRYQQHTVVKDADGREIQYPANQWFSVSYDEYKDAMHGSLAKNQPGYVEWSN